MSATVETKIWLAIKTRIESLSLSFDIAWPAQTYSIDTVQPYIRVGRVTAEPVPEFIAHGKAHTRRGYIILTLVYPLANGHPLAVIEQYAGTIAAHFADGVDIPYKNICVSVTSYPHVVDGYESDGYINIPVRIPWRCSA